MLYALARTDGGVSLMVTTVDQDPQDEINKWSNAEKDLIVKVIKIDKSQVPLFRRYRDAWTWNGSKVVHDMPRARNILRRDMRIVREPLLQALDRDYMRADEAGNTELKQQIAAKKQALRDVTNDPAIEAAATAEDLMNVWPDILGEPWIYKTRPRP
jgi:hypothetical protein